MSEYFEHEIGYGTYLELKSSIGAFACLDITSVSLLGCPFVPKPGSRSLILGFWSKVQGPRSWILDLEP